MHGGSVLSHVDAVGEIGSQAEGYHLPLGSRQHLARDQKFDDFEATHGLGSTEQPSLGWLNVFDFDRF